MQDILKSLSDVLIPIIIQQGPEILAGVVALLYTRDWRKLKNFTEDQCLKIAEESFSNEEKLNRVIESVINALPKKYKVFPASLFVNASTIKNLVNLVYVTRVKPKRDVEGSNPSIHTMGAELNAIKEKVNKVQLRDEKGRFKKADE